MKERDSVRGERKAGSEDVKEGSKEWEDVNEKRKENEGVIERRFPPVQPPSSSPHTSHPIPPFTSPPPC